MSPFDVAVSTGRGSSRQLLSALHMRVCRKGKKPELGRFRGSTWPGEDRTHILNTSNDCVNHNINSAELLKLCYGFKFDLVLVLLLWGSEISFSKQWRSGCSQATLTRVTFQISVPSDTISKSAEKQKKTLSVLVAAFVKETPSAFKFICFITHTQWWMRDFTTFPQVQVQTNESRRLNTIKTQVSVWQGTDLSPLRWQNNYFAFRFRATTKTDAN